MVGGIVIKLSTALNEFTLFCEANGLSEATIRGYRTIVNLMIKSIGDVSVSSVSKRDMLEYVAGMRQAKERYIDAPQKPNQPGGLSKASIASYITTLSVFWSWYAEEYSADNPMKGIKRPKRSAPEPKSVATDDFVKLFDSAACLRDKAILAVLADTGCRIGGLMDMSIERLNLPRRRASVTEKGGKTRTLFFTHYTAQLVGTYIGSRRSGPLWMSETEDTALTKHGVYMMLKNLKRRTGITGRANPHSFRHGFAREYIRRGGDISTLAKLLGHSDVSITARYYAVFDEDELQDFHDKFTPMGEAI
jgi:site-specific recombinase XerD